MKILFVNTGPWGTGSFSMTYALTQIFEKEGHQVKNFFPDNNLPSLKNSHYYGNKRYSIWKFPIHGDGVSIASFPLMLSDPNSRSGENPILFSDLSSKQLTLYFDTLKRHLHQIIEEFKPDVIDTQHIWSNGYAVNELNKKYFVTAHNSDQMSFLRDTRMKKFAKKIAETAIGIFASTDFLKAKIIDLYQIDPKKIYISPNGYNQEIFKPATVNRKKLLHRLSVSIPEKATIITCIGKISKTKGIDILLKANNYLTESDNIHFIVFGAGDINKFLAKNDLLNSNLKRIHFVGHQTARVIAQANNISKLSILPSRNEGFPLAILEAMGCGLPMVVSQRCNLDKFAIGESFPIKEPKLLAQGIKKIIALPEKKYQALSQAALTKAKQYDWENIASNRLDIYKKLLFLH